MMRLRPCARCKEWALVVSPESISFGGVECVYSIEQKRLLIRNEWMRNTAKLTLPVQTRSGWARNVLAAGQKSIPTSIKDAPTEPQFLDSSAPGRNIFIPISLRLSDHEHHSGWRSGYPATMIPTTRTAIGTALDNFELPRKGFKSDWS